MRRTITRTALARVLALHRQAYRLLMWLDEQAASDPSVLDEGVEHALIDRRRCSAWLSGPSLVLPVGLAPRVGDVEALAGLLSSFFQTSFGIERIEWEGRCVRARLRRGAEVPSLREGQRKRRGGDPSIEAVQRVSLDDGIDADRVVIVRTAKSKPLGPEVLVWTYAVGLLHRAEGHPEGRSDWKAWRSIPVEERRRLTIERVWAARDRIAERLASEGGAD